MMATTISIVILLVVTILLLLVVVNHLFRHPGLEMAETVATVTVAWVFILVKAVVIVVVSRIGRSVFHSPGSLFGQVVGRRRRLLGHLDP